MSEVEVASTGKRSPLLLIAGVLALIVGIAGIEVLATASSWFFFEIAVFVVSVLAFVGGVLALSGKAVAAPWPILGGLVVWMLLVLLTGYPEVLLPWRWHEFMYWGSSPLVALNNLTFVARPYLLLAAFILALIAFVKQPKVTPLVPASAGVAVVNAEGSIDEGWYADPDGKPAERFWDGSEWTDKTRPVTAATALALTAGVRPTVDALGRPLSSKSRAAAAILCFFLGIFGIHRFYVGKIGTGVLMLITAGGLGVWALIDFVWILVGTFKDKAGALLATW